MFVLVSVTGVAVTGVFLFGRLIMLLFARVFRLFCLRVNVCVCLLLLLLSKFMVQALFLVL